MDFSEMSEDTKVVIVMLVVTFLALLHPLMVWLPHLFVFGGQKKVKKPPYEKKKYWEDRYVDHPDTYEWLCSYKHIKSAGFLNKQILEIDGLRFLDIGCGNSELAEDMYEDSGKKCDVTSVDYSKKVIEAMQQKHPDRAEKYVCEDFTKMSFGDATFDFVIDKGTLLINADDKELGTKQFKVKQFNAMIREIARVINVGGTFLSVSSLDPKEWGKAVMATKKFRPFQDKTISMPCGKKTILVFLQTWKRIDPPDA